MKAPAAKLLWLVLLLLGCPAPCAVKAQPWKFIVFGDSLQISFTDPINTGIVTELAQAITNEQPAFVVIVGDLTYTGTAAALHNGPI